MNNKTLVEVTMGGRRVPARVVKENDKTAWVIVEGCGKSICVNKIKRRMARVRG